MLLAGAMQLMEALHSMSLSLGLDDALNLNVQLEIGQLTMQ